MNGATQTLTTMGSTPDTPLLGQCRSTTGKTTMRTFIAIAALFFSSAAMAACPDFAGKWAGTIEGSYEGMSYTGLVALKRVPG